MKCMFVHPAYRNFSLWFLIWFLGWAEAPESGSGFDQQFSKCIMQASRTRRAPQGTSQKLFRCKVLEFCPTACVSLMALHTLGPVFDVGRVPSKRCFVIMWLDIFLVRFLFWSLHIPPIGFVAECGLMALWQRWSIIHHQGGWHGIWNMHFGTSFLSATRHKLHSCSFSKHHFDKFWAQTIFLRWKHTCQTCKDLLSD